MSLPSIGDKVQNIHTGEVRTVETIKNEPYTVNNQNQNVYIKVFVLSDDSRHNENYMHHWRKV